MRESISDARWLRKLMVVGAMLGVVSLGACKADLTAPAAAGPLFDSHGGDQDDGDEHEGWGTGRSGSAAIAAYALFGTDGTTLTVTSYRATDALFTTPVGCIDKIQVKVYNAQGRLVSTQNFNDLDDDDDDDDAGSARSSVSVRVRGAQVGYRLALHVNVSCIDRRRTDVIDADVDVIPANTTDPAVIRLHVPGTPLINAPVTISAYVKVPRGLAPASGNCALYVNGSSMATLGTVTIAAGESVACAFTPSFTTPGTVQVMVAFENVSPTDLNPANNSASTSMPVYDVPPTFSITANLYDDSVTYHNLLARSSRRIPDVSKLLDTLPPLLPGLTLQQTIDALYPLVDTLYSSTDTVGHAQHAQFDGTINTQVRFPLASVTVSQRSGSTPYHSQTWTNISRSDASGAESDCVQLLQGGVQLTICAYGPDATFPNGRTMIAYSRDATSALTADVRYEVDYRTSSDAPLASCNTASTTIPGQCYTVTTPAGPALVPYGSTFTFDVALQDATHRFSVTVTTNITRALLDQLEAPLAVYSAVEDNATGDLLRFRFIEGLVNTRVRYSGPIASLIGLTQTLVP